MHARVSNSLRTYGLSPTRLFCPQAFSRQEYWSWLPCPPPGDLPDPGMEAVFPALQADSLATEPPWLKNLLLATAKESKGSPGAVSPFPSRPIS